MIESEWLFRTGIILMCAAAGAFTFFSVVLFITGKRLLVKLEKEFGERRR